MADLTTSAAVYGLEPTIREHPRMSANRDMDALARRILTDDDRGGHVVTAARQYRSHDLPDWDGPLASVDTPAVGHDERRDLAWPGRELGRDVTDIAARITGRG